MTNSRLDVIITEPHPETTSPVSPLHGKLSISASTVILAARGWLYVINRKRVAKIQAAGIEKVHQKLYPYLNGMYSQENLLSAVTVEQRVLIKTYLDAMLQAGAIRGEAEKANTQQTRDRGHTRAEDHDGIEGLCGVATDGKHRIFISLEGNWPTTAERYSACIIFLRSEQMVEAWKAIWTPRTCMRHLICVVVTGESGGAMEHSRNQRMAYAQWLISSLEIDAGRSRTLRVYRLEIEEPSLALLYRLEATSKSQANAVGTELTSLTNDPQLPLLSVRVAFPFWPEQITRYGLEYEQLSRELERELIVRIVLAGYADPERISFVAQPLAGGSPRKRLVLAHARYEEVSGWAVAGTLLHARVRALENCLYHHTALDLITTREVDFLQASETDVQIGYLTKILGMRIEAMRGTIAETRSGLFVVRYGVHCAYSVIEPKAVRDLLLTAAANQFYENSIGRAMTGHQCDFFNFLPEDELDQLLVARDRIIQEQRLARRFLFKRVNRWGYSAWVAGYQD
jgi:hypothetical protein